MIIVTDYTISYNEEKHIFSIECREKSICGHPLKYRDSVKRIMRGRNNEVRLQGSQTSVMFNWLAIMFYTLTNLQGSQTTPVRKSVSPTFYTLTNLQGSQTHLRQFRISLSFTLLQTYKVLKRDRSNNKKLGVLHSYKLTRFSNIIIPLCNIVQVLHSYKLTRFSNVPSILVSINLFYTLTNLQGSQT